MDLSKMPLTLERHVSINKEETKVIDTSSVKEEKKIPKQKEEMVYRVKKPAPVVLESAEPDQSSQAQDGPKEDAQ